MLHVRRSQVRPILVITREIDFQFTFIQVKSVEVSEGARRQVSIQVLAEAVSLWLTRLLVYFEAKLRKGSHESQCLLDLMLRRIVWNISNEDAAALSDLSLFSLRISRASWRPLLLNLRL